MIPTFAGFNTGLSAPAAPVMDHHTATGQFIITNYDSSLVYTATLVSGTGSATLNTSTGVYTLSGANSRFSVTAGYAASAPQSDADFMERKAYTCTTTFNYYEHPYINATPGACHGAGAGVCPGSWTVCTDSGGFCGHNDLTATKNATPSGYTDSYNEWWRVS